MHSAFRCAEALCWSGRGKEGGDALCPGPALTPGSGDRGSGRLCCSPTLWPLLPEESLPQDWPQMKHITPHQPSELSQTG